VRVTVGVDIGTTSVKAVAADDDGTVVARARVPHPLHARHAGELAHDAAQAWRAGVLEAYRQVASGLEVAGAQVAAMVPSLCAVDRDGVPISDGLLYGDARGADPASADKNPSESGELVRFLAWLVGAHPDAAGFWPAQAVANAALTGRGAIDTVTAMTTLPLFDFTGWDPAVAAGAGLADISRLPDIVAGSEPIGTITDTGVPVGPGTIDAFAEQLVAGADRPGDVLVILGATLIAWVVVPEWTEVDGLWTVPHTAPGLTLVGGPSNAGGLFVNWARRLLGGGEGEPDDGIALDPERIPIWQPYPRGERVPLHDPDRRAALTGLDIGMGPAEATRAVYEASGFALRRIVELAGGAERLVCTGGGTRDRAWVQALADASGLPAEVVGVPEGGALGAAYLARVTAGLEPDASDAARWVSRAAPVEPDPAWRDAVDGRYERFLAGG
jgi:xylulokinase